MTIYFVTTSGFDFQSRSRKAAEKAAIAHAEKHRVVAWVCKVEKVIRPKKLKKKL